MRKLLNTLYITTPESYLTKDGENIVVSVDREEKFRVPAINIESIVTFGYMGVSPGLMKLCSDHKISLCFLSPSGKYIGRFQSSVQGNVLLRKAQYNLADSEQSQQIANLMIAGKIRNSRNVLRRHLRDYGNNEDIQYACSILEQSKNRALNAKNKQLLRGIEGDAAKAYYGVFSNLILNQKEYFTFEGRNRRPPKDAVNALLSFSYTLLAHECSSALETVGIDPYVGFMHTLRPGRPSLALDMMEELRAYMCDRLVLSLINRGQIKPSDFISQGETEVTMTDAGRKTFLTAWQQRKKEVIQHPFLQEKVPIGLLPYVQALLLARYIRKDLDSYPVFLIH